MKARLARPRGRPRSFDRDRALQAATRLFRERGYDGATLADLQKAMGVPSPPSLYAAFGSKEDLFKEAVSKYVASTGEAGRCALAAPGLTARDAIEQVLRANATAITEDGEPTGCMLVLGALNRTPKLAEGAKASEQLHCLRMDTYKRIVQRIQRGIREGDVRRGTDVDGLATFLTALLHGLSVQARDGASRERLMAAIDTAMTVWDAIAGSRRASSKR